MVSARLPKRLSVEDYLKLEEGSATRNEFVSGVIYAMAGGSADHSTVCTNLVALLHQALDGKGCRPHGSDLRVYVEAADLGTYPDVAVYCGPMQFWKGRKDVAVNPTVIFEVLSPSTLAFDRGEKFEAYKMLPSLRSYVLVSSEQVVAEVFTRQAGDLWAPSMVHGRDAVLTLQEPAIALPLGRVYDGVSF